MPLRCVARLLYWSGSSLSKGQSLTRWWKNICGALCFYFCIDLLLQSVNKKIKLSFLLIGTTNNSHLMQTSAWKHKRFILTVFAVTCDRNMEKKCRFFNLKFQFLFEIKETYFISELSWFETSIQYSESFNRLDEHVPHCCLSDIYKLQSCCSRLCLILFWTKLITCRLHLHNFLWICFKFLLWLFELAYCTKCHTAAVSWAGTTLNAEGRFCRGKKAQVPSTTGRPEQLVYQSCHFPFRPRKWKKVSAGVLHKRASVWHTADRSTNLWPEH